MSSESKGRKMAGKKGIFQQVYTLVKQVPAGKVVTYRQVAGALGLRDARIVGWALHRNKERKIPCHRVVNKEGFLAKNYAFGGWREQRRRLLKEGVRFLDSQRVDLGRHSSIYSLKGVNL